MDIKPTVVLGMEEEAAVSFRMIMFCYVKTISLNDNVLLYMYTPGRTTGNEKSSMGSIFLLYSGIGIHKL